MGSVGAEEKDIHVLVTGFGVRHDLLPTGKDRN
jgi:hypothetical protein